MSKKMLNPTFHLYIPEDSAKKSTDRGKVSCEINYFEFMFKRRLAQSNWLIKEYTFKQKREFIKSLKNSKKKEFSNDQFYVLLDADLSESTNIEINGKARHIHQMYMEFNQYNRTDIIISNHSWEVWMCMHKGLYKKPFINQDLLNNDVSDDYSKNHDWYKTNRELLMNSLIKAIDNSKKARLGYYSKHKDTCSAFSDDQSYENNLNFSNQDSIISFLKFCRDINCQITYVDILVKEIMNKIDIK